ncbi:MAG: chloride channel protein [Acidimicrobiales bacterium]
MRTALRTLLPEARGSRLLGASALLGVLVGVAVAIFEYLTVEVVLHEVETLPLGVQALAPLVGLGLTAMILRTLGNGCSPSTSDEYIKAYHMRTPSLPTRPVPARLLAGAATIGFGGSLGLEGPSIYTGSSLGLVVQRRLERWLGRGSAKLLLTAGAAAGVAAIFQAPATGVLFALESPYRDDLAHRALLPSLVASAAAYLTFVSVPFVHPEPLLGVVITGDVGAQELVGAVLIGVGAGLGGRAYASMVRRAKATASTTGPLVQVAIGGGILGALAVVSNTLFDEPLSLGPGVGVVEWLDEERSLALLLLLFVVRAAATFVTVGAGGAGGLFIPLAVQGVLLGRIVSAVLDEVGMTETPERIWPVLGLAAFLAAGYRTPIAAVMFVAESTAGGGSAVVPALVAAAVSQLVAGRSSVAKGQQVERRGHLEERITLPLTAALTTDVLTVPSDATVAEFVWNHALGQRQRVVPVVDGRDYLGLCTVDACSALDREAWTETSVAEVMLDDLPVATPSWSLRDVLVAMDRHGVDVVAVVDDAEHFVGVVHEAEIVKLGQILADTGGA